MSGKTEKQVRNKARDITQNTIKRLYGLSLNTCANPNCPNKGTTLILGDGLQRAEIAHIKAASKDGPRYDPEMTDDERRDISNLILLCETCNKEIDNIENVDKYPVELLQKWKKEHESFSTNDWYTIFQQKIHELISSSKLRKEKSLDEKQLFVSGLVDTKKKNNINEKKSFSTWLLNQIKEITWTEFSDICLKGIAGIGKSTEMKIAFNDLIDTFSDRKNYDDYQFSPIPYFYELKRFNERLSFIPDNDKENYLIFLDGLDELSDTKIISLINEITNIKKQYPNIKFIISGRDSSFFDDYFKNFYEIKIITPNIYSDPELKQLVNSYENTPLRSLISIPFYREFALSGKAINLKTKKDFLSALIEDRLIKDKEKSDYGLGISKREEFNSPIKLNQLKKEITSFCVLCKESRNIFSEKEIEKYFSEQYRVFFEKSALINYISSDNISFVSNIYFEYFYALKFFKSSYKTIRKEFFLKNKKNIDISKINILSYLLCLLDRNRYAYKKLCNKLGKLAKEYIFYTDFTNFLSPKERYDKYIEIYEYYNRNEKYIYYGRFLKTNDLLDNIESLSDKMIELLPEDYERNAFYIHYEAIKNFLETQNKDKLFPFINSVILFGVYSNNKWIEEDKLKEIAPKLIRFFITEKDNFPEIKGLLSEKIIFNWYVKYNWTYNWAEQDWIKFQNEVLGTNDIEFSFSISETSYSFKLLLFDYFHSNNVIRKLFVPLAVKLILGSKEDFEITPEPDVLDDNYKIPILRFDEDPVYFKYAMAEEEIDISELLEIMQSVTKEKHFESDDEYSIKELTKSLKELFISKSQELTEQNTEQLFQIFLNYSNEQNGINLINLTQYFNNIPDKVRINLAKKVLTYFSNDQKYQWTLIHPVYSLLDISIPEQAEKLLKNLKKDSPCQLYRELIAQGYFYKNEHPCNNFCKHEYPLIWPDSYRKQIQEEKQKEESLKKREEMQKAESEVISSKEKLFSEISKIYDYLDSLTDDLKKDSQRMDLIYLDPSRIDMFSSSEQYSNEVFSDIARRIIIEFSYNDSKSIAKDEIFIILETWFDDEKKYWRFFFYFYAKLNTKENVTKFLNDNPNLRIKIEKSMKIECQELLNKSTLLNYEGGGNRAWVIPFVYYISILYSNILPAWIDSNKMYNFVFFPAWDLYTNSCVHVSGEINWYSWSSVFSWLNSVTQIPETKLVEYAISKYDEIQNDRSKTQIISYLIEKFDYLGKFQKKIIDLIIQETKIELKKDYENINSLSIMNCNVLSHYWNKCEENYVQFLRQEIDFSRFIIKDNNYCRKALIEYFCRKADFEQRAEIINYLHKINDVYKNEDLKTLLTKLGDERAIIMTIDEFIQDKPINANDFYYSSMFGDSSSIKVFKKLVDLYIYSIQESSNRRQMLYSISSIMIKREVNKKNFKYLRKSIEKEIKKCKTNNSNVEFIQGFLNEIEQEIWK